VSSKKGGFMCPDKLLSGRLILTITCAGVFVWVSIAKIIPPDAIISILTMVFISYFQRPDRGREAQQKGETK
jgi:hypothetical protein